MKTLLKNRRSYRNRIGSLDHSDLQDTKTDIADVGGEESGGEKDGYNSDNAWDDMYGSEQGRKGGNGEDVYGGEEVNGSEDGDVVNGGEDSNGSENLMVARTLMAAR